MVIVLYLGWINFYKDTVKWGLIPYILNTFNNRYATI